MHGNLDQSEVYMHDDDKNNIEPVKESITKPDHIHVPITVTESIGTYNKCQICGAQLSTPILME